jgi:hypothetical protein
MAINPSNLHFRESATGPNRGGDISASTDVTASTLFSTVTGEQAAAGLTDYRGIFVQNADSTDGGLQDAKIWIEAQTPADDAVDIALCDEGASKSMETIAAFTTAPDGPSFSRPANKTAGLSLGTLAASGGYYGIWIRRTVPSNCDAYNNNSFTLKFEGDSAA